ncbi:MAG: alpha-aminoadipate/glutamate carrier protein LysW/ArgW [Nitrososphaerales archaeon]
MVKTKCSECDKELSISDDSVKGEIVTCPDCGSDFEIVNIAKDKVELKPAEKIGEDWGE